MATPGFSLEGGNGESPTMRLILIGAVVTLVIIGIIFAMNAFRKGDDKGAADGDKTATETAETEQTAPAATSPSAATATAAPTPAARPRPPVSEESLKEASDSVRDIIRRGQDAEAKDDLVAARDFYYKALEDKDCGNARKLVEDLLGNVNISLIFSPREMPGKIDHAIAPGESLAKLAAKYNTPVDLIAQSNNIKRPERITAGDRIRLLDKPVFEIFVGKKSNDLLVTLNGKFFKRYIVGTGRYNKTPEGTFKIKEKIKEPPWWKDGQAIPFGDKENILGTRWMELEATGTTPPAKGYGIHGTWDDTSLGQQSSAGCVRMRNADVEELFTYVPHGCAVTITE